MTFGLSTKRLGMRVAIHPCTRAGLAGHRYGHVRGWQGDSVTVRPYRSARSVRIHVELLAEMPR